MTRGVRAAAALTWISSSHSLPSPPPTHTPVSIVFVGLCFLFCFLILWQLVRLDTIEIKKQNKA